VFNRRKTRRMEVAVPFRIQLLGTARHSPHIETFTKDISPFGLATDLRAILANGAFLIPQGEERVNVIPYLVLEHKAVALEITLPDQDKKIEAQGKIAWYDFNAQEDSYFFRVGIVLTDMEVEDRHRWEAFVRNITLKAGKLWQQIQIVSTVIFIAGIVIFVVGLGTKLVNNTKIGLFLSLIGLIGFVIAWWRYRSFLFLRRFRYFRRRS
jgi:hypothetical protein